MSKLVSLYDIVDTPPINMSLPGPTVWNVFSNISMCLTNIVQIP